MDYKQAHEILKKMLRANGDDFTANNLTCLSPYLSACAGRHKAELDGYFNADELEAIALWLRNPEQVAKED